MAPAKSAGRVVIDTSKRYRIVMGAAGAATKCPICQAPVEAASTDEVEDLLRKHLRKSHSREERNQAAPLMVK